MNSEKIDISKKESTVIGKITSGALHSLKNYLQSIIGLSEILDANPQLPKDAKMDVKLILEIAEDATDLVNKLRIASKEDSSSQAAKESTISVDTEVKKRADINILVADDDPLVLRVVAGMLTALGYGTTTTRDGQEAYEKYLEDPSRISIVLADLDMPRLSGLQLAERLLKENPENKIIVMTGYIHEELGIDPDEFGLAAWLEKPMTAARLEGVIKPLVGV